MCVCVQQLALSSHFPAALGVFTSAQPPPRYGIATDSKLCEEHEAALAHAAGSGGVAAVSGPLTPPTLEITAGVAPHAMFTYAFVGDAARVPHGLPSMCVGQLVAAYGRLAATQPLFTHLARSVLAGLCDIDAMCTHGFEKVGRL
jgi:hypothetical protein